MEAKGDEVSEPDKELPRYPNNAVHMIRYVSSAHLRLSQMADSKASLLMGATFVTFTITVGQSRGAETPLPLLILGTAAFFSAICAVLAVLPAAGRPKERPMNLLFFGAFTELEEEEYIDRLTAGMRTDDGLYRSMARDIYQNGRVLKDKKYRLLGWAYRIFLAGLVASAAAFVWVYWVR